MCVCVCAYPLFSLVLLVYPFIFSNRLCASLLFVSPLGPSRFLIRFCLIALPSAPKRPPPNLTTSMKLSESDSILFRLDLPGADFGVLEWQISDSVKISRTTDATTDRPSARWEGQQPSRRTPRSRIRRSRRGFPCCHGRGFQGVSGGVPRVSRVSANVTRDRRWSKTLGGVQNPGFEAEGDGRASRPLI